MKESCINRVTLQEPLEDEEESLWSVLTKAVEESLFLLRTSNETVERQVLTYVQPCLF